MRMTQGFHEFFSMFDAMSGMANSPRKDDLVGHPAKVDSEHVTESDVPFASLFRHRARSERKIVELETLLSR